MVEYTMALIINRSLGMSPGKVAAQVAHGAVLATLKAMKVRPEVLETWVQQGQRKICLQSSSKEDMLALEQRCQKKRIQFTEVRDAGLTEIPAGSLTVVVLGPGSQPKIESLTRMLKLY